MAVASTGFAGLAPPVPVRPVVIVPRLVVLGRFPGAHGGGAAAKAEPDLSLRLPVKGKKALFLCHWHFSARSKTTSNLTQSLSLLCHTLLALLSAISVQKQHQKPESLSLLRSAPVRAKELVDVVFVGVAKAGLSSKAGFHATPMKNALHSSSAEPQRLTFSFQVPLFSFR